MRRRSCFTMGAHTCTHAYACRHTGVRTCVCVSIHRCIRASCWRCRGCVRMSRVMRGLRVRGCGCALVLLSCGCSPPLPPHRWSVFTVAPAHLARCRSISRSAPPRPASPLFRARSCLCSRATRTYVHVSSQRQALLSSCTSLRRRVSPGVDGGPKNRAHPHTWHTCIPYREQRVRAGDCCAPSYGGGRGLWWWWWCVVETVDTCGQGSGVSLSRSASHSIAPPSLCRVGHLCAVYLVRCTVAIMPACERDACVCA